MLINSIYKGTLGVWAIHPVGAICVLWMEYKSTHDHYKRTYSKTISSHELKWITLKFYRMGENDSQEKDHHTQLEEITEIISIHKHKYILWNKIRKKMKDLLFYFYLSCFLWIIHEALLLCEKRVEKYIQSFSKTQHILYFNNIELCFKQKNSF